MPIVPVFGPTSAVSGGGDMKLIFSTTLTSSSATITTGTLQTGFSSLLVSASVRSDRNGLTDPIFIRFNGDTTNTNYQHIGVYARLNELQEDVAVVGAGFVSNAVGGNGNAGAFTAFTTRIFQTDKTDRFTCYQHRSSCLSRDIADQSTLIRRQQGIYRVTSAVTSITYDLLFGDFVAGSTLQVHGIK